MIVNFLNFLKMGMIFTLAQPSGPQLQLPTNDTFLGTPCRGPIGPIEIQIC